MEESKNKKKAKKLKATTGAWWKGQNTDKASEEKAKHKKSSAPKTSTRKAQNKTTKTPKNTKKLLPSTQEVEVSVANVLTPQSDETTPKVETKANEIRQKATEQSVSPTKPKRNKNRRSRKSKKNVEDVETVSSQQKTEQEKDVSGKKPETEAKPEPVKSLKLLINAEEPEECRLALLEDGRLESIHVSTISKTQRKNNIYKAKIVAIEPSLQAAFVDYGTEKNGFLPFSEIHPEYFKKDIPAEIQEKIELQQWKKLSISDLIERDTEILVQVVKEEVGKKGANMTTFLSIPGRCVVLMPGSDSAGISRRISGEERRSRLRRIMQQFDIPEGIGWIVRTASIDITENALNRDTNYLLELWSSIRTKGQEMNGTGLLYEDHRTVSRFLREYFDPAIEEILVDDRTAMEQVKDFISMLPQTQRNVRVRLHQGIRPIFNQYSVEDQIESIYQSKVNLPSGGSIVIDPTEALVAVDVNSGSTSKGENFEESIFQANIEAANEIARQLRLRDLGGLIVVDFIDMRRRKHIAAVEKQIKQAMKRDKAKVDFSKISKFGLMQISRQKLGAPIESGNYRVCEYCKGRGMLRSIETLSLFYLRRIQTGASRQQVLQVECHFPMEVASYLLNHKRIELADMEKRHKVEIIINARSRLKPVDNEIIFHKEERGERLDKKSKKNEK